MLNDATTGNSCLDECVKFFITPNSELEMTRRDALNLWLVLVSF